MPTVSTYLSALFPADPIVLALREEADRAGLPPSSASAATMRLVALLLVASGARRVLEIGTLGGSSTIWIARALPADGRVITIERDPEHAVFAQRWLARAGVADRVDVRVGRALDLLPALDGERFDAVFLDADREPLPRYLEWAMRLLRPGGLVIADHALAGGRVAELDTDDAGLRGLREFNRRLALDDRLLGTVVAMEDGVAVAVVKEQGRGAWEERGAGIGGEGA